MSTTSDLKSQEIERRQEFGEGEQRGIGGRMDEMERRLARVEDKLDL